MAKKNYSIFEIEISKNFTTGISTKVDWEPNTNIIEAEEELIIEVELPGVNKEDVSIVLQQNQELVIRGIKPQSRLKKPQVTYYLFEREFGHFYKKIIIDFPLDISKIQSVMENGVLTVRIPKKKTKIIEVNIK
ncbi:MAG: Hsp20/alpha crystallin family protein [Candidatus Aminicenantes bacterium]|nr:Hsp20/alpha crystallin family protein [Candidatus Aminicenantes bacterium]